MVVVVGSINVDQFTYCARLPDDGETLVAHHARQAFGGKGANQAVMAARLGARAAMVGCVGDDALGDATLANLEAFHVDAASVTRVGTSTGVAPIWVDDGGTNRILVVPGANADLDADLVHAALAERSADVVVAQLETPQNATAAAFTWARARGAITIINPAPAAPVDPTVLASADWVVANEAEFELLTGGPAGPEAVADASRAWGSGVVVTLGAAGAVIAARDEPAVAVPALRAVAVDSTGAGDAFVGTFAVALAAGSAPLEAARAGCVAGALSVASMGTHPSYPTLDEVLGGRRR